MQIKKLPKEWIYTIGKDFFIKECGGSGDCLFYVFATALNDKIKENVYNAKNVREAVAHSFEDSLLI